MTNPRSSRGRGGAGRRGMTFIEVVVSVGLLAGLASIVLGAVALIENASLRDRYRLDAMEVAHRVVLQMVDDPRWLDGAVKRVEQNGTFYHFEVERDVMVNEDATAGAPDETRTARRRSRSFEDADLNQVIASQVLQVRVTVFRELDDGSITPDPIVELLRVYNPVTGSGRRGIEYMMWAMEQKNFNVGG